METLRETPSVRFSDETTSQGSMTNDHQIWITGDTTPRSYNFDSDRGSNMSRVPTAPRDMSRHPSRAPLNGADLEKLTTLAKSNTVTMTMEAFEKLYLSPQNRVSGNLRSTFAVPTPLPLIGLTIGAGPLGCSLMGWRGASGLGIATIGASYFFGGMLQIIGAVMEWLMGNTFPFITFGTFGAFFLAFATNQNPQYGTQAVFLQGATTAEEKAAAMSSYQASLGFFWLFMALLVLIFLVCALRTNVVYFSKLLLIEIAICLLMAASWRGAEGDTKAQEAFEVAAGACVFAICIIGYYLILAQMLEAVAFPFVLPVGDLSTRFGRNKRVPKVIPPEKDYNV